MNTLSTFQPLPRINVRVRLVPRTTVQRRSQTDRAASLHRNVQSELQHSDHCHSAVFALLAIAGLATVALALLWPFAGMLN
jgi:hypothetical protein